MSWLEQIGLSCTRPDGDPSADYSVVRISRQHPGQLVVVGEKLLNFMGISPLILSANHELTNITDSYKTRPPQLHIAN